MIASTGVASTWIMAGGVDGPEEQRHAEPGHALGPEHVNRGDEIDAGEDRAEAEDERAERRGDDRALRPWSAVRRVERPAGIESLSAGQVRCRRPRGERR